MPFYEYQCLGCGDRFVLRQSMSEAPAKECPACRREVRRVFSAPVVAVKGGSGSVACAPGGG